jgi:hypothetical protein
MDYKQQWAKVNGKKGMKTNIKEKTSLMLTQYTHHR